MKLTYILFVFINTWFVSLFLTIPFFVRKPEVLEKGEYASAPAPMKWKKALWTNTLVCAVLTIALCLIISSGYIDVKDLK